MAQKCVLKTHPKGLPPICTRLDAILPSETHGYTHSKMSTLVPGFEPFWSTFWHQLVPGDRQKPSILDQNQRISRRKRRKTSRKRRCNLSWRGGVKMGVFFSITGQSGARIQAHTHTCPHRRADPLNSTNIDLRLLLGQLKS